MLQSLLRNDTTERLLQDIVDGLHELEQRSDASSWEKAARYVAGYDDLRQQPDFEGSRGQVLTRKINKRLRAVADQQGKKLPRASFLSNARTLANVWEQIFTVNRKLPYDHYMRIAICALPRDQKESLREWAEREQPTEAALRQTIRSAVDAHRGLHWPDFPLKVSNFWKFDSPHDNNNYGGIHPEVVANLLFWFTEPGDVVIDPMAGSGVLADTLTKYRFFRENYEAEGSGPRHALMSDVAPMRDDIMQADAADAPPCDKAIAKFAIVDPPYLRIADDKQYQNIGDNLDQWLNTLGKIIANTVSCLRPGGAIAVITDDLLRKNEHEPIAFHVTRLIRKAGLVPCATIYNHTPNFLFSMGPAQMKGARIARLLVNGCKIIQVARLSGSC